MQKNEDVAIILFKKTLQNAVTDDSIIYVIAKKEHLSILLEGAIRILITADIELIKTKFTARMRGNLPLSFEKALEKKHGCFDAELHDLRIDNQTYDINDILQHIQSISAR